MKRFDKGYIYSNLLSDLFGSIFVLFAIFGSFISDEETTREEIVSRIPIFAIAFVVIYVAFTVYRILYYKASGYELTQTEIKCKRGVFFRKNSILDYKKVHAINKKQNLIHRIFGIAVLTVDSGSTNTAHQAEITIVEKNTTVDFLLRKLNALKENGEVEIEEFPEKEEVLLSESDSLYNFTSKKKMLYSLISILSTAFFVAVIGVLCISVIGICKLVIKQNFLGTWGEYCLYSVLITAGAILLCSLFSFLTTVIYSFVGYYNFTVTKTRNDIQISFGLLEKHTNSFNSERIKAVKISQGLIQRMLGFASIKLEVIGYTNESGEDSMEQGVLVPFCKYEEACEILGRILPDYVPDTKQSSSVSFFPFVSWFFLIFGSIAAVTLASAVAVLLILGVPTGISLTVLFSGFGVAVIVILIKLLSSVLAYQTNGLAVSNGKITVYCGGFNKTITVFMNKNLIAVEDVTTPLRHKNGITSIVMHLKTNAFSNEVKLHIQKESLLDELETNLTL